MNYKLRTLREDNDKKQVQIAEYLMCDQCPTSKHARGERGPPLRTATKLARFYGAIVDYLVGRADRVKPC